MSKFTIHMSYDHNPINPRSSETLGNLVCWNDKYNFGDKHSFKNEKDFLKILMERENIKPKDLGINVNDLENSKMKILKELRKRIPIIPIYLYDGKYPELNIVDEQRNEKGIFVGYIYMDSNDMENHYGSKDFKTIENGLFDLFDEISKYGHYVNGDNYKFQILKDGEEFESISGFTGNIYDDVIPDMKKAASEILEKEGIKSEQVDDMFGVDAPQIISNKTYESVPSLENEEAELEI